MSYTQFIVSLILQSSYAKLLTNNKNIKKYMHTETYERSFSCIYPMPPNQNFPTIITNYQRESACIL